MMWRFFEFLYSFFCKTSKILTESEDKVPHLQLCEARPYNDRPTPRMRRPPLDENIQKFYKITQNIRNSQELTIEDMHFIHDLDNEKLIELIQLYNLCITHLSDFINKKM